MAGRDPAPSPRPDDGPKLKAERETILTDLFGQSLTLRVLTSEIVIPVANTPTVLATAQPMRLLLAAYSSVVDCAQAVGLVPATWAGPLPFIAVADPVIIHAASQPLLVSMQWWVTTSTPTTLTVFQVIREQQ